MADPGPRFWEMVFEVYEALPRQGPGDRASAARALALCGSLPPKPSILDLGCGAVEHATAHERGWSVTDDAALFERLGLAVQVMEAPPSNIKITTPFDLTVAEAVLAARP